MKHLIKTKSIARFLTVALIAVSVLSGCRTNDKEIDNLNQDLVTLRADVTTQISNLKTELETTINNNVTTLTAEIDKLKTDLAALTANAATKAELEAAKAEILSKTVSLEAFNAYKTQTDAAIKALQDGLALAATKAELTALEDRVNAQIVTITNTITALGGRIDTLEGTVGTLSTKLDKTIQDLAALKADTEARLLLLEGILQVSNGQSAVINDIKAQLADQLAKITANSADIVTLYNQLSAVDAKIQALEAEQILQNNRLTSLEAKDQLIDQEIANLKTEIQALKDANAAQDVKISALEARVVALEQFKTQVEAWMVDVDAAIDELQAQVAILNNNMKAIAKAVSLNFNALSNRLTSLTFIADYYVNGIPAMNFSPLLSACDTITPEVVIAYRMSPSFITEADIEVDNMSFNLKKDAKQFLGFRAPAVSSEIKAEFEKIEDGDIYVRVKVADLATLFSEANVNIIPGHGVEETFPQVLLQVPLSEKAVTENELVFDTDGAMTVVNGTSYPADRVISASHWVRLDYVSMEAQGDVYLALNNRPTYTPLVQTAADAMALAVENIDGATATDPTVITLPFEETINLVDTIAAIYNNDLFDVERYGLNFKFDLLDESGMTYTYIRNGVNQQTLIDILDPATGTIKAKNVAQTVIAQSLGRTPIIRVTMYNDQDPNCPVLFAFVKVVFEEQPDIKYTYKFDASSALCEPDTLVVGTQWTIDSIYDKVGFSSVQFHTNYQPFTSVGVGTVSEIIAPDDANTLVLSWEVPADTVWKYFNANPTATQVTFTNTVTYQPVNMFVHPDFVVTLTKTYTKPYDAALQNITQAELIASYWFDLNGKNNGTAFREVKHNVNVPDVGENTPTNNKYESNITGAFVSNADLSLKGYSNYQYYFKPTQKVHNDGTPGGTTLTVSPDGQQLMNGPEIVATINPFATNVGDLLVLNNASATAKRLLNYDKEFLRATLGVRYDYCPDLLDTSGNNNPVPTVMPVSVAGNPDFDVVFVRPINASPSSAIPFIDGVLYGETGSYMTIKDLANLYDWRNVGFGTADDLYGYYDVTNVTIDIAAITTNLNGTVQPLADFPQLQVAVQPSVPSVIPVDPLGYLTYQNSGLVIGSDFELYVPVTITHHWGQITSSVVTITVQKTIIGTP
ncbi:MAG: hypothetical protein ACK5KP_08905 [Paludibacteraceae bacterium]